MQLRSYYFLWGSCVAACWVLGVSFTAPAHPSQHQRAAVTGSHPAGRGTSLSMGLRSFLQNKVKRIKSNVRTPGDDLEADEPKGDIEGEDNDTKPVIRTYIPEAVSAPDLADDDLPPFYHEESVQDRINRVKSGKMTDEEKQAFLRTALSAKDTTVSRAPLRQALPREDSDSGGSKPKKFTASASPFPKDTLLRNFARGNRNSTNEDYTHDLIESARTLRDGSTLASQKKKKEYLEMVTDPNRFHTYKSSTGDVVSGDGLQPQIDTSYRPQEEPVVLESMQDIEVEEDDAMAKLDLGQRLEAAAIAQEQASKAKEQERLKLQREREEYETERKRIVAEQTQLRAAELAKKQLEEKARQREREEEQLRAAEERRRAEETRLRELEAKQDEYWQQKLKQERDAKMKGMVAADIKKEFQKEVVGEELRKKPEKDTTEKEPVAEEALTEAVYEGQNPNFPRIERSASDILGKKSLAETNREHKMASKAFRDEQSRKKEELDRQRDEQIARLKSLNSPLPSTQVFGPPAPTPVPPPVPTPTSTSAQRSSSLGKSGEETPLLRDMTKLNQPAATEPESSSRTDYPRSPNLGVAGEERAGWVSKKGDTGEKRVIRQQLPLKEGEDDFDTFARNGPNKNMSIGDAMKTAGTEIQRGDQDERSKKWGIDMSRINQSLEEEQSRDRKK